MAGAITALHVKCYRVSFYWLGWRLYQHQCCQFSSPPKINTSKDIVGALCRIVFKVWQYQRHNADLHLMVVRDQASKCSVLNCSFARLLKCAFFSYFPWRKQSQRLIHGWKSLTVFCIYDYCTLSASLFIPHEGDIIYIWCFCDPWTLSVANLNKLHSTRYYGARLQQRVERDLKAQEKN